MDSSDSDSDSFDLFIDSKECADIIQSEVDYIIQEIIDEDNNEASKRKKNSIHKKRKRSVKNDFKNTEWMQMINNPDIRDDSSKLGKTFRRRFRVPFVIFDEWILPICIRYNVFEIKDEARVRIPIEIKIMIALRILGRANCADDIQEMSEVPSSSIHVIFKMFVRNFSRHAYELFVKIPQGERLKQTLQCYSLLGFPGCVGCIDGTQVVWFRSPKKHSIINTGKEDEPTLGFLIVVDHSKYIMYVSQWFHGSANDISKIKNDPHMRRCMSGQLADIKFNMFTRQGTLQQCKGAYFITDGGMPKCSIFIDPIKNPCSKKETYWSEWLESVRKDVECAIGAIKTRFRFLWFMIFYHDYETIEHAFKTSCIIHNMLLIHDGNDLSQWGLKDKWLIEDINSDSEGEHVEVEDANEEIIDLEENERKEVLSTVHIENLPVRRYRMQDYMSLKHHLIDSFHIQYSFGLLTWPRQLQNTQKKILGLPSNIIDRVKHRTHLQMHNSLYRVNSLYICT